MHAVLLRKKTPQHLRMPPATANPSSRSEKWPPSTITAFTDSPGSLFLRQISTRISAARAPISSTLPASTCRHYPRGRIFPIRLWLPGWTPMSPRCRPHRWKGVPRNCHLCLLFTGPFLNRCRSPLHQEPESVVTGRWLRDPQWCPKITLTLRLVHWITLILNFLLFGCCENCVDAFKFVYLFFFISISISTIFFPFYLFVCSSFLGSWKMGKTEDSRIQVALKIWVSE